MTAGDVVFFWQSGANGGLRGKGFISEKQNTKAADAVNVDTERWLGSPILRGAVLAAEAISGNNLLLKVRVGTNFKLTPVEADRLDLLLRTWVPPVSEALRQLLRRHEIAEATPEAISVIDRASRYVVRESERAQVTSTRLLFALVDSGESLSLQGNEGAAAAALARAFSADPRLIFEYRKLQENYLGDEAAADREPKSVRLSPNVLKIFNRAIEIGKEFYGHGNSLTADGLVAALLQSQETGAEKRLLRQEVSLRFLPELMLQHFTSNQDRARFAAAMGISKNVLVDVVVKDRLAGGVAFAGLGNDDPWGSGLKDSLGVGAEAMAFARVATARTYKPPFAFGVFGDWGSGKSFFMRLIHDHIDGIRLGKAPESKSRQFVRQVVQIRFNAWHYAEQNLWASLVDHIFAELDRSERSKSKKNSTDGLLENLSTARELTLDAAETLVRKRHEQRAAAGRLAAAKVTLANAQQEARSSPLAVWKVAWGRLVADNNTKENVRVAAKTLGLESVADAGRDVGASLKELQGSLDDGKAVLRGMLVQLTSPWLVFVAVIAIALLPQALVFLRDVVGSLATGEWKTWISRINETALTAAGLLSAAAALLRVAALRVSRALSSLASFRENLEVEFASQTSAAKDKLLATEKQVVTSAAAAEEARAVLASLTDSLADAEREYAAGTGRTRLLKFIRNRAEDGHYAKHLGLVASIRKDFADISAMIEGANSQIGRETKKSREAYSKRVEAFVQKSGDVLDETEIATLQKSMDVPAAEQASFQRVVLYIDDLDRCRPDKVVDVLQAVHLLLTFPLFVVIVAVDTRWVSKALVQHYGSLVDADDSDASQDGLATAGDYLEKIFQVPYWVRPMENDASRAFLEARANEVVDAPDPREPPDSDLDSDGSGSVGGSEPPPEPQPHLTTGTEPNPDLDWKGKTPTQPVNPNDPEEAAADIRSISLTPAERSFMSLIATSVATTPRRALRFLNVYRVIKAGLDSEHIDELENKAGYRALMVQLAIATSSPNLLKPWLKLLDESSMHNDTTALIGFLEERSWFVESATGPMIKGALKAFSTAPTKKSDGASEEDADAVGVMLAQGIEKLRDYGLWARRYSFGG
jgi:hypothetical protein